MTDGSCREMQLLVQADHDGELTPAEAARVSVHLEGCAACRATAASLEDLSGRLRAEVPSQRASAALRRSVAALATPARPAAPRRLAAGVPFGAGFALAACLALLVLLPRPLLPSSGGALTEAVIADHIRSLQPGHLTDVLSTDQHTVKPWFDGRLAFSPPVKDLSADDFPLTGGRLDYLDGREVAALLYHRRQHVVQLFVWPDAATRAVSTGAQNGYNYVRWAEGGMAFWAVSDLNAAELGDFVRLWRSG